MVDSVFTPSDVRSDLGALEKLLKRLAVEWEMYFSQAIAWPPNQRIAEIEAIIRHYTKEPPARTAERFRFNALVHRYHTRSELWARKRRSLEESGLIARRRAVRRGEAVEETSADGTFLSATARGGRPTGPQLRELYSVFRQARQSRGESTSDISYRRFAERVSSSLERARSKGAGRDVELRVAELGGRVKLVVKPVRGEGDVQ